MKAAFYTLVCCLGLLHSAWAAGVAWNYEGNYYWPEQVDACAGDRQSPINIEVEDVLDEDYVAALRYHGYYAELDGELENNGHVLQFNVDAANIGDFEISHAQLPNKYTLAQFHFHWGSTNDQGSEHTIDGVAFPMEMHMVHYNSKYDDITDALASGDDDALAVIGMMFHIGKEDFTPLDDILVHLTDDDAGSGDYDLDEDGDTEDVTDFQVYRFLDETGYGHYYYRGSLTTPTCNQQVFWIVMERTISISQGQIDIFRQYLNYTSGAPMVDNYRPPQPLNNRIVRRVEEKCRCEHPDAVCAMDGTCYVFFSADTGYWDFEDADAICDEQGMIIAEPRTLVQYEALVHLLDRRDLDTQCMWLNLEYDTDGFYYPTDADAISYSNWDSSEPDDDGCAYIYDGVMYDEVCTDDSFVDELACQEFKYTDIRDAA